MTIERPASCASKEDEDRVQNRGISERNSLSGKNIACPDGDIRNKFGYNGEAFVLHMQRKVIPWEVVIDPVSTLVTAIQRRPGWSVTMIIWQ